MAVYSLGSGKQRKPCRTGLAADRLQRPLQRRMVEAILPLRCTVIARYLYDDIARFSYVVRMSRNSVHQSTSSGWRARTFVDNLSLSSPRNHQCWHMDGHNADLLSREVLWGTRGKRQPARRLSDDGAEVRSVAGAASPSPALSHPASSPGPRASACPPPARPPLQQAPRAHHW